jgi:hypothetical protein
MRRRRWRGLVWRRDGQMTDADLERAYRRWLRWYPRSFRREHEAEMLGVLLAAGAGQRRPASTRPRVKRQVTPTAVLIVQAL